MKKLLFTLVLLSSLTLGTAFAGSGDETDADGGIINKGESIWLEAYIDLNSPVFFDLNDSSLY